MDNKCVEKLLETVAFSNGCICSVELIRWEHTHFHPSGNVFPSKHDKYTTQRLREAGELLDIELLDHIIVGGIEGQFFSFQEEKMLHNDFRREYAVNRSDYEIR